MNVQESLRRMNLNLPECIKNGLDWTEGYVATQHGDVTVIGYYSRDYPMKRDDEAAGRRHAKRSEVLNKIRDYLVDQGHKVEVDRRNPKADYLRVV